MMRIKSEQIDNKTGQQKKETKLMMMMKKVLSVGVFSYCAFV